MRTENGFRLDQWNELTLTSSATPGNVLQMIDPTKAVTIAALTNVGTLATATAASHGFFAGQNVQIAGASDPAFNVYAPVEQVIDVNTFTYRMATLPTVPFGQATAATLKVRMALVLNDSGNAASISIGPNVNATSRPIGVGGEYTLPNVRGGGDGMGSKIDLASWYFKSPSASQTLRILWLCLMGMLFFLAFDARAQYQGVQKIIVTGGLTASPPSGTGVVTLGGGGGGVVTNGITFTNTYQNALSAASTDWQSVSVTPSYANGETTLVSSGLSGSYVLTNYYTCANDFRVSFRVYCSAGGAIGFGVKSGYGVDGNQSFTECPFWEFAPGFGTNGITFWHVTSPNPTTLTYDVTTYRTIPYANTDSFSNTYLTIVHLQYHGVVYLSISNETTGTVLKANYGQNFDTTSYGSIGGSGNPTLAVLEGTVKVREFKFDLIRPTSYLYMVVGDSIGCGFSASGSTGGWANYAAKNLGQQCIIYGRPGDRTEHTILATNEIKALNPSLLLYAIGGNDTTLTAHSAALLAACKAQCTVIDMLPTPRGWGGAPTPVYLVNWMQLNGTDYIDIYTSLLDVQGVNTMLVTFQGPSPHPNDLGHHILGDTVAAALKVRGY